MFIKIYKEEIRNRRSTQRHKFFSALIAYMKLNQLKNGGKYDFNKTLFIEDYDDMEPVLNRL